MAILAFVFVAMVNISGFSTNCMLKHMLILNHFKRFKDPPPPLPPGPSLNHKGLAKKLDRIRVKMKKNNGIIGFLKDIYKRNLFPFLYLKV